MLRNSFKWMSQAGAAVVMITLCGAACGQGEAVPRTVEFRNPLPIKIADPYVLKDGDTYYMYGTQNPERGFKAYSSTDLVNWEDRGFCFRRQDGKWGKTAFWAPEVYKRGDTYYMFFTAQNPEAKIRNICIATAKSPLGPFVEEVGPLLPHGSFIDNHLYEDPDTGTIYCYATVEDRTPNELVCGTMKPLLLEWETSPTAVVGVSQPKWENQWVEGPFILKHKDVYYLMYSGNAFWEPGYSVGYATGLSPMGPWTKAEENPILTNTDEVHGPGHHCVTVTPDGKTLVMFYHTHHKPGEVQPRVLAMDVLEFDENTTGPARLRAPHAPSNTTQTLVLRQD